MKNSELKKMAKCNLKRNAQSVITVSLYYILINGGLIGISTFLSPIIPMMYGLLVLFGFIISRMIVGKASFYLNLAEHTGGSSVDLFSFFNNDDYSKIKHCYLKKFAVVCVFIIIIYCGLSGISCELFGWNFVSKIYYYNHKMNAYALCLSVIAAVFGMVVYVLYSVKYLFLEYVIVDKYREAKYVYIKNFKNDLYRNFNEEIFAENNRLMDGNYFRALKLVLSFSGWFVLSVLTFGLGFIYFLPYYNETIALFYLQEKESYNRIFEKT